MDFSIPALKDGTTDGRRSRQGSPKNYNDNANPSITPLSPN
ncbi:hypothetical protein [Gracilimonas sp.]